MNNETIEMPIKACLYRQSSVEMRLTPELPPDDDESGDEEVQNVCAPKIIDAVLKQQPSGLKLKSDFKSELEKAIKKPLVPKRATPQGVFRETPKSPTGNEEPEVLQENCKSTPLAEKLKEELNEISSVQANANEDSNRCKPDKPQQPKEIVRAMPTQLLKEIQTYETKMATLRPKSPRPVVTKTEKEESIWDKLGTLGRKKRIKEVQEVQAEGKNAIDSPLHPVFPELPPEEYELEENEERSMVEANALEDHKVKELIQVLIEWINDELAPQRIIVQNVVEDLYDGQVLQKLLEKLTNRKLDVPEVTLSESGQKQKLGIVLHHINVVLGLTQKPKKWNVESVHRKDIVSILYLLVAIARHFRAPIRLPEHVTMKTVVVQKINGQLNHRFVNENITSVYDDVGMRCERDAFDTLFDHAPDKLQMVKKSMVTFVNKHLNKINLEVTELETQFHDGVYLTLLMGLLEGFFVPLYCFHLTPKDNEQKVHNVAFAFELIEEVGLSKPKARPEDIVNMDLKSTLRVLYILFLKYKDNL